MASTSYEDDVVVVDELRRGRRRSSAVDQVILMDSSDDSGDFEDVDAATAAAIFASIDGSDLYGQLPLETHILTTEEKAEGKKEAGNCAYKNKDYKEALRLYTEAIELCPTYAPYYGNRAACHMMLGQVSAALEDARHSTRLDENFVKGHAREAKCQLALGDGAAAERALLKAVHLEPNNKSFTDELNGVRTFISYMNDATSNFAKRDYRTALYHVDRSLQYATASLSLKLLKAECLVYLVRHDEAQDIVYDIMRSDSNNADAIYVRGLMLYYQDNVDKAFAHFAQVLKLAPDHERARDVYKRVKSLKQKKEEGNAAFRSGLIQKAYDIYTTALAVDPNNVFTNAKLYLNRAIVCSRLNNHNQAVKDCTSAIQLDEGYVKAYLRRAKCYMDMEMYDEAVRDYEKVCKLDKSRQNAKFLQDAKLELKKSKRKDYYRILGIARNATDDDIKKAYRKRALEHHPDRHANASDVVKKEQEKKFKDLGEAYGILSDPKKKYRYDSGQDLDVSEGGHGHGGFDPYNIFQTFYHDGSGGNFTFTNMGDGGGTSANNGFPGGFTFQFN